MIESCRRWVRVRWGGGLVDRLGGLFGVRDVCSQGFWLELVLRGGRGWDEGVVWRVGWRGWGWDGWGVVNGVWFIDDGGCTEDELQRRAVRSGCWGAC